MHGYSNNSDMTSTFSISSFRGSPLGASRPGLSPDKLGPPLPKAPLRGLDQSRGTQQVRAGLGSEASVFPHQQARHRHLGQHEEEEEELTLRAFP